MKFQDNTLKTIKKCFLERLIPVVGESEAESLLFYWFNARMGWSRAELRSKSDEILAGTEVDLLVEGLNRLTNQEPIQYVLGFVEFAGCKIRVNNSVLIPRPETEELVYLLVNRVGKNKGLRIADLCSGSGCIALGLKRNLPLSEVLGFEFSDEALEVSRENAAINRLQVDFKKADVLKGMNDSGVVFDLIVSNPPYIAESEKTIMGKNVLDFEPHMALFTGNEDALLFYKAIIKNYTDHLSSGGMFAFEINEKSGKELVQIITASGHFSAVECLTDLQGKDRFVVAVKNA